ncbi:hypothetical protein G6F22_020533 [Rhizopus arrhizus]|nr:hypothetical protein G6F22_020533 [Rhizopus arrhizus]KAG0926991.1 hypothetical protein G6F31_018206 [Rhizopus arrhizus]KAG1253376.1 hypothetical protein G6F68_011365 [Rhizopus microsporus]
MTTKTPPRLLTAAEVGACIRQFRQLRHWSQEQLAEISGLNVRTVQRVEQDYNTATSLGDAPRPAPPAQARRSPPDQALTLTGRR